MDKKKPSPQKTLSVRAPNAEEEARKKTCLEQLSQDRQRLVTTWPFIGSIIMRVELVPVRDDRLDTASTDGDNIFVDIDFWSRLSKEERLFVLAHEIWHGVLLHFARRQGRDAELFNIAADLEIHFALSEENMHEPFVLPHDTGWSTLSAEEIYEKLPEFFKRLQEEGQKASPQPAKKRGPQITPGKNSNPDSFGDGTHSFDKHVYQGEKSEGVGGQEEQEGAGQQDGQDSGTQEFVMDQEYSPRVSSEAVERSRSRTIAAAQQVERMQGDIPRGIKRLLDELMRPSLPWQEMLKQFVTTCYGGKRRWLPPSRRHVWQGLYLPSMRDGVLKAVVALDTSGSTQEILPAFFGELVSLMRSFGKFDLEVIQCDHQIRKVEHYSETNPPPADKKWEVWGCGGTDFCPVFEHVQLNMKEKPDLLLFFTDGYGDAPRQRPPYPVMWILTKDGRKPAVWGSATKMN